MSNQRRWKRQSRRFKEAHDLARSGHAPGDPNMGAGASVLQRATQKARRENPAQYRAMKVAGWLMVIPLAVLILALIVVALVRLGHAIF